MASLCVTVEQVELVERASGMAGFEESMVQDPSVAPPLADPAVRTGAEQDPIVVKAREYATGSLRVLQALRPRLTRSDDRPSIDAADRLEETCITVASKIHRAVSSETDGARDPQNPQDDANGSAKVALLLIEESKLAWRDLMRPGHAVGNGAPAGFVATLDALKAGLLERFPRALEFVRPGFDTLDKGVEAQIARAMLNQQLTTKN